MFDLEVFVGPAIVLLGMFIGLLGFAIWGVRAIRESAPLTASDVAPLVDGFGNADLEAAEPLAELSLPDIENDMLNNADGAENLEKTAEFEQPLTSINTVASFSQSFWEGQEVPPINQSDYNDAIDRIQADLDAADAVEFNKDAGDADAMAAANVLEALRHGVVNADAEGENAAVIPNQETAVKTDNAVPAANETPAAGLSLDAEALDTDDNEATRLISREDTNAILLEESEEALPAIDENEETRVLQMPENSLVNNMEETVVMQKIAVDDMPEQSAAIGAEQLDAVSLEETRMHQTMPAAASPEKTPATQEPTVAPNLQRMPPGMASSFGFINNQANGMASATQLRSLPDLSNLTPEEAGDTLLQEPPIPFGPKMAWLAIPGFKPSEVIAALRLDDVQTANWTKGLQQAYADNNLVFVSPSLGGWVMVIGKTLWERADMNRSAENIPWLKEICRKFGNACFFSTMQGLGNHGWVGIRDGQIARAYGYSGELQELIWLIGEPTEEEIAINPAFITEMREKYQPGFRPIIPDEKLVLAVAAAWSVDPGFRRRQYPADFGFLGYMN